ncbi:MAG: hypothetical protein M1833_001552 [Piccolia ochrophora]|nr:MAG: hypothetical protein M1833_001552 [Piccolia ochrophora]
MTAVAPPPSFQPLSRATWNTGNGTPGNLNSMSSEEVSRMFMPRKSAQRSNSSSSVASSASGTSTITQSSAIPNGNPLPTGGDLSGWSSRKKPARALWSSSKSDSGSGMSTTRPHPVTSTGPAAQSVMAPVHQSAPILPSQHMMQSQQQQNGTRVAVPQGEGYAALCLLPLNGTFERKTISVPYFPEVLRIGRQTNAKTLPTPVNGFFDSKVLSRQHAEIWADRLGKIWIRDVKSSNGTFVNAQRLSAENRDSEPHELREQDILELGIDIMSEDQKTVVHHKVAARVEHAGFQGNSTNVLDLSFGDIDPMAGGGMMAPSISQNGPHMRGRTGSQGSVGGTPRMGPGSSTAGMTSMNAMGQQRHMNNLWLTPVTVEHLAKKLSSELKSAKQQQVELQRTGKFFVTLLKDGEVQEDTKTASNELRSGQINGLALKAENKPRFTDPPAPPPQQPLPEKPDASRPNLSESSFQPSLKRTETEKPKLSTSSPTKSESQVISLVEALASAKREIDSQGIRVRDLEDMLRKERTARQSAEDRALQLEKQSEMSINVDSGAIDESSEPGVLTLPLSGLRDRRPEGDDKVVGSKEIFEKDDRNKWSATISEQSAQRLQQRLELMVIEMDDMKQTVEKYKRRVEVAEEESATSRKTLAEMVEKIRRDDSEREKRGFYLPLGGKNEAAVASHRASLETTGSSHSMSSGSMLKRAGVQNGKPVGPAEVAALEKVVSTALAQSHNRHSQLAQSAPYASILGVVVIGVGLMAFLNGWQKVER